ncbi:MAG: RNA 2',3'-cyclic phosphodiesterase [Desulfocapsaceae bacterium]
MIRLFVGLPIDSGLRRTLALLGCSLPGARPVPEDQIHLTLRFIGEVSGEHFNEIKTALGGLNSQPLSLTISGTGHFPPRGIPRVVWAGVQPAGDIIILRNRVNHLLRGCGVEPEHRKFHPHVTIARLKNTSPGRVADFLASNALLHSPPFTIDRVELLSSRLNPKGAVHTVEAIYPLGAPEEPR